MEERSAEEAAAYEPLTGLRLRKALNDPEAWLLPTEPDRRMVMVLVGDSLGAVPNPSPWRRMTAPGLERDR